MGASRILIATDSMTRLINASQRCFVISYELPLNTESYLKRIGRRGCYGRKGTVINFVSPSDTNYVKEIEKYFNTSITELP